MNPHQNKNVINEPATSWLKELFSLSDLKVIALADLFLCKDIDQDVLLSRIKEGKLQIIKEGNMLFVPASEVPGLVYSLPDGEKPI